MGLAIVAAELGWHVRDLVRAARRCGHADIEVLSFHSLAVRMPGEGGGCTISARPLLPDKQPATGVVTLVERNRRHIDALVVRTVPPGTLEQIIFRMDALHMAHAAGVRVVNRPRVLECAIDKALTAFRLSAAGLPTVPTFAAESAEAAAEAFTALGGDVVAKPLFGSEGKGIVRLASREEAYRVFHMIRSLGAVFCLQPFIADVVRDVRILVLGGRQLAAMERRHATDWRHNVARGAHALPYSPTAAERDLAERAAAVLEAEFCGVDLLVRRRGDPLVLEVNGVPGWRAIKRVTGVDVAVELIRFLL